MLDVKYIDLGRRFVSLAEAQDIDPELWLAIRGADGRLGWKQLLERKRVVILAEAGSGKSTELEQQFRAWKTAGHAAFHGKVQTVGRRGLMAAIGAKSRSAFEAWQASDEPAWFFLDSVDKAKLDNIRLDDALGAIADVLDPYLGRAHIVLSGRHTDWEFRRDLERLADILPVPNLQPLEELSDQERLDDVIHNRAPSQKAKDEVKPEAPLVVVLAGLDEAQIRRFAGAAGITDLDDFCDALKRSDLLDFAKRPLDLDWLALGWKRDRRFGAFAHMLDQALQERSRETDPLRAQQAPLDPTCVRAALRRIGAALVLSRNQAIAVPDSGLAADPADDAIDLQAVLPDWQPPNIQRLARLPAFDPGTPGRARLHNDNQGVVRGFLAADWMRALRANNCPVRSIFDLLFADVYGHAFVRPSMRETAAWLSLWDEDVANETLKRDPFVLLNFGDPGSLPPAVRERALEHFTAALVAGGDNHIQYDHDALRRFAKPDLASAIRKAWAAHGTTKKVRAFLLQLIWLGEIEACSDLAVEAAYAAGASRIVVILAGRALMVSASDAEKQRYAAHIKAKAATLPITAVWDGADKLFPATLSSADFIAILDAVDLSDGDSIGGLETDGAAWAQRLDLCDDLVAVIEALDAKVARPYGDIHGVDENDDRQILPMMVSAARRLLDVVGVDEAPDAAIDVLLRIGGDSRGYNSERNGRTVLAKAMHRSSGRRRAAFWRAAHRLKNAKYLTDGLDSVWKMQHFGYEPGLVLKGVIDGWTVGSAPSPEMVDIEKRHDEMKRQDRLRKEKVSKSWKTFIDSLRDNPDQLRKLRPVTSDTVDRRLHDVWQLLSSADRGRSRYAIDTADALKPLLSAAAAQAVEDALIDFWRKWTPNIRSGRAEDKRDLSYSFDNMGIAGVAMEARRTPDWPAALTEAEALRAAQFATLELNGFPSYVTRLAARFPNAVRDALMTEIRAELDNRGARGGVLEAIANTEEGIARVLAQSLEDELRLRTDFGERHLNAMLEALAPVVAPERREDLTTLFLERFQRAGAPRDEQIEQLVPGIIIG